MSIWINGVKQEVDPRDADLVVANAKTGDTFYAGSIDKKTASGTQTLSHTSEAVAAGYYAATTLSTVDADLAAVNIKKDEIIFGFTGTLEHTIAEDALGEAPTGDVADNTGTFGTKARDVAADAEVTLATVTPTFDADSITVAVGAALCKSSDFEQLSLRLYIGGSLVDSEWVPTAIGMLILKGTLAVDGAQECKVTVKNVNVSLARTFTSYTEGSGDVLPFGIGVGSIKLA